MELSFTTDLDENIAMMKRLFVHDDTFICREVRGQSALRAALFFFDGMVNSQAINESIVKPISLWAGNSLPMPDVIQEVLQIDDCPFDLKTDQLLAAFLYGDTIVLGRKRRKAVIPNDFTEIIGIQNRIQRDVLQALSDRLQHRFIRYALDITQADGRMRHRANTGKFKA